MTGGKKMVCHTEELHGGLLNQGSTVTTAVGGSVTLNPQNLILACQNTNNLSFKINVSTSKALHFCFKSAE